MANDHTIQKPTGGENTSPSSKPGQAKPGLQVDIHEEDRDRSPPKSTAQAGKHSTTRGGANWMEQSAKPTEAATNLDDIDDPGCGCGEAESGQKIASSTRNDASKKRGRGSDE